MVAVVTRNIRLALAAAALVLGFAASTVRADVRDAAEMFGAPAVADANKATAAFERQYHKQLVIETFAAVPDDRKADLNRLGKEAFFRDWMAERARALKVNGVYVLVCADPKHLEVGAGRQTVARRVFTKDEVVELREKLQAAFKGEKYDDGLADAVDFVGRTYARNLHAGAVVAPEEPEVPTPPAIRPTTRPATTGPATRAAAGQGDRLYPAGAFA